MTKLKLEIKIKQSILENYHSKDLKLVNSELNYLLNRYNKLTNELKSFVIGMLINLNRLHECFKLINKELEFEELKKADEFTLKRQAYFAYIKIHYGQNLSATLLIDKIIKIISTKNKPISENTSNYIINMAYNIYSIERFYDKILELQKLKKNNLGPTSQLLNSTFLITKCFKNNDYSNNDLMYLQNEINDNKNNDTVKYYAQLKYYTILFNFNQFNKKILLEMKKVFPMNVDFPISNSWHALYFSYAEFFYGDKEKSKLILEKANSLSVNYNEKLMLLFWIKKFNFKMSFEEEIFLKLNPIKNTYTALLNGETEFGPYKLTPIYQNFISKNSQNKPLDCYKIEDKKLSEIKYNNCNFGANFIDLRSGVIVKNKSVTNILTEKRINLIRVLIASGSHGAHISFLIDYVLQNEYINFENAELRIKNLIIELKKINIEIKRRNNYYFYNFKNNKLPIIFPKNNLYIGPLEHIKNQKLKNFNLHDVSKILNIKGPTASKYIKQWKNSDFIEKSNNQSRGSYHFKT